MRLYESHDDDHCAVVVAAAAAVITEISREIVCWRAEPLFIVINKMNTCFCFVFVLLLFFFGGGGGQGLLYVWSELVPSKI